MLKDQTILVTGATGQVGRAVAEQLNANNTIWAAARFSDETAKAELEALGINTTYFSIGEADLSSLPDVDYVIHCGCNTNPKTPEIGVSQNAEGTGFLMERYHNVKGFFHMSSSSIYALPEDPRAAVKETDELGGKSEYSAHYAMSKQSTEAVVRFQARRLNLPTIIARLDTAYGTYGHGGVPSALVEFMKYKIPYTRAAGHDSYCSLIHQDDIVEQIQGLLEHASVPATTVNLGGDEVSTIEELLEYVQSLTGLEAIVNEGPMATWQMTVLDNSKRKELAGPCKHTWKEGVKACLQVRYPDLVS